MCALALLPIASDCVSAQQTFILEEPGEGLPQLLKGNQQFGARLLREIHSTQPEKNVVVSPISLTVVFGALQNDLYTEQTRKQIGDAFGWGTYPHHTVAARMLLAAFEKPEPPRPLPRNAVSAGGGGGGGPEAVWITNTLLYHSLNQPRDPGFALNATKYFGMKLVGAGTNPPTAANLKKAGGSTGTSPKLQNRDDIWISSGTHLQTRWKGNAFSMSNPHEKEFVTKSGQSRQVTMVTSESTGYRYAKTDDFEAVALPCMVAVLPGAGKDMRDLERDLAENPGLIDSSLKLAFGDVTMPYFRFHFAGDLRPTLEAMGIKDVFKDLDWLFKIHKSHLTGVSQSIDIEVNRDGIRVSGEKIGGFVYLGVIKALNPFHMQLNRPFLFLIHEQNTNALLFLGVVMDPSQN
jgi:serine protease inhibitor